MTIVYLPIARKTFDLEAANDQLRRSKELLHSLFSEEVSLPDELLTSPDELAHYLESINLKQVKLVIYQSVTFADGEFIEETIKQLKAPVLVWSVREPSIGGRLRLNSLTGGNSTCHVLRSAGRRYEFVFGNPEEHQVRQTIQRKTRIMQVIEQLKKVKVGVVGEHPPGFFFSGTNDEALFAQFGVETIHLDLMEAFQASKKISKEQYEGALQQAEKQVIGLNRSDETVTRFAQFTTHMKSEIKEKQLSGLAIRCWPDFFTELGAAACSTLSHLTEEGLVSSCESDIHGALSMYILQELSASAPYLGDMVHLNEASNSVVLWHCGAGAYSLAHPASGATPGVHPNRKIGFTMEFGLKPGKVTMFRISYTKQDHYRLLIMRGDALDTPKRFNGTSVEIKLETDATDTLNGLMKEGFEPHYALVYGDVCDELVELGNQLGLPTHVYTEGRT